MTSLLNRFSLHATDWNGWVGMSLVLVWICVIACVISSIFSQPFDIKQRIFWTAIVVLLPVIGILAYLPFAFRKENLPLIFMRNKKPRKDRRPHPDAES